jgi:ParB family chromosome partitioning protein
MAKEIEYIDPDDLIIIGLDTDHREKDHVLYDERAFLPVDEELVADILLFGVQKPILVRKEAGKKYVVDGRQRVKSSREAKKRQTAAKEVQVKVPAIEVKGDDKRVSGIMNSVNEHVRQDDPLTRAFKLSRYLDLTGDDADTAGIVFGRSVTTIRNWQILVNQGDTRLHVALKEKKISLTAAIELSKMPREMQLVELEKHLQAADGGAKLSEAKAKKLRQEATGSTAAGNEGKAAAAPGERKKKSKKNAEDAEVEVEPEIDIEPPKKQATARQAVQKGIQRTWVRDALKTKAAQKLDPDQLKILKWFAWGEAAKGDWFDDFRFEAETEMGDSE